MEVFNNIDWFRYTVPLASNLDTVLPNGFELGELCEPLGYYNMAYQLEPCGRIDFNTNNRAQGMSVNLTGQDLRSAEMHNLLTEDIIADVVIRLRGKVTRIDLAVDVLGAEALPDDCLSAYLAKQAITRARRWKQIIGWCAEQDRAGNTVYVGSRAGENYMRIYQKGLEIIEKQGLRKKRNKQAETELIDKLKALDYIRVELEIKGKKAAIAARAVEKHGTGKATSAALNRFLQLPTVTWWNDMLSRLPSAPPKIMEGERNSKGPSNKWLMTQALPAVLKAIAAENDAVIDAVRAALGLTDDSNQQ